MQLSQVQVKEMTVECHSPSLRWKATFKDSMSEVFIAVWEGENSHDGYTVAILAAMAFSFSQVQFQHLWFDFHTPILGHILTFYHIHSADNNVSFFCICCRHHLQALYTSFMTVSTEFVQVSYIFGASLSQPHTRELNSAFLIYIYIICCMLFCNAS